MAYGSTTAGQNHTNDDTTADYNYEEDNTIDTEEDNSRANIIKENTPSTDSTESDTMAHHDKPQEDNTKVNRILIALSKHQKSTSKLKRCIIKST